MINQLAELHEIAPDVCYSPGLLPKFAIADYGFWQTEDGELIACPISSDYFEFSKNIGGQPALDWLQGALQRVIEARGWGWRVDYRENRKKFAANIWHGGFTGDLYFAGSPAAALLSALIAALKADL